MRSTLSKRAADWSHWFEQRRCFFSRRRSDELRERDNTITVGIRFGVKFSSLFERGASGLSQFLNVKGTAPVLVGGDEVLGGADKFWLFLNGRHLRFRSRFRFGNQF